MHVLVRAHTAEGCAVKKHLNHVQSFSRLVYKSAIDVIKAVQNCVSHGKASLHRCQSCPELLNSSLELHFFMYTVTRPLEALKAIEAWKALRYAVY